MSKGLAKKGVVLEGRLGGNVGRLGWSDANKEEILGGRKKRRDD